MEVRIDQVLELLISPMNTIIIVTVPKLTTEILYTLVCSSAGSRSVLTSSWNRRGHVRPHILRDSSPELLDAPSDTGFRLMPSAYVERHQPSRGCLHGSCIQPHMQYSQILCTKSCTLAPVQEAEWFCSTTAGGIALIKTVTLPMPTRPTSSAMTACLRACRLKVDRDILHPHLSCPNTATMLYEAA